MKTVMLIRGATKAEAEEAVSQAMSTALPRWQWRNVCDRSMLQVDGDRSGINVSDLIGETADALVDDEPEQRWCRDGSRSSLGGIQDGQHRLGAIGDWSPWREAFPGQAPASAAEAVALEAMRAASHEHLAAVEYQLMTARAELQATVARLELAQLREQKAAARALRAEQDAARAKEQAEKDAATAADALADAALERAQEIINSAQKQAADILADAQRQAMEVIAAAKENAQERWPTEPVASSSGWAARPLFVPAQKLELAAICRPARLSTAVTYDESAIAAVLGEALTDANLAINLRHVLAAAREQASSWTTQMDAKTQPGSRRWTSMMQRFRHYMGFSEPEDADTEDATDYVGHRCEDLTRAVELTNNFGQLIYDCAAHSPATNPTDRPSGDPCAADPRRRMFMLTFVSHMDYLLQVTEALAESTLPSATNYRASDVWSSRR